MKTSIEWYQNAIFDILKEKENISDEIFLQNMLNIYLQAKEMEKKEKLKYQLFIGKVSEIIGDEKTIKLLRECYETFKSE
jgi:hypothetical protein